MEGLGERVELTDLGRREVLGRFDGGAISSDGGALLLREVEKRTGIVKGLAGCFTDHRDGDLIEHRVEDLIGQRVMGLACGYEDLNDHDALRHDPLLAVAVGKDDPTGQSRVREQDRGKALAGKSTLNRLELTPEDADAESRYKKIVARPDEIDRLLVDVFLDSRAKAPKSIVLDVDATDDPLHGDQEGRFFHGYYKAYCYLPLYIFCEEDLLCARLRTADVDPAAGAVEELERIVERIRARWPQVRITVRGDSGFCRDELMSWCESNEVRYLFGLAKNTRLVAAIKAELEQVEREFGQTAQAARTFKDFRYRTLDSWSCERRVVGKAEHLANGANPRFVVTDVPIEEVDARTLYERHYCARGDMENRIKEQQLALFADRTSTHWLRSNQLRLYFSSFAYVLMRALRRLGLAGTEMARAQCGTIRLKLLKVGAHVRISVRKVWVSWSGSYPWARLFLRVWKQLMKIPLRC
jgi:hypothetical protein